MTNTRIYNPRTMNKLQFVLTCVLSVATYSSGQQTTLSPEHQSAHDIFKELIEINTTDTPAGNVTTAAEAMAKRLRDAGFTEQDVQVLGPMPAKGNLEIGRASCRERV